MKCPNCQSTMERLTKPGETEVFFCSECSIVVFEYIDATSVLELIKALG